MSSPKILGEKPPFLPIPSFWWLQSLAFLGSGVYHFYLYLDSQLAISKCPVSGSKFPSSYKDSSHWIRAHHNPLWLHPHLFISAITLFPSKVTVTSTDIQDLNILEWGRHNSIHNNHQQYVVLKSNYFLALQIITL